MHSEEVKIRKATIEDAEIIVGHRCSMFFDMGHDEAKLRPMVTKFRSWLVAKIMSGEYHGWLAITPDGSIIAGAGLWLMDWPPHVIGSGSHRGNIVNVFTAKAFRRQGIARRLMEVALQWCRENGVDTVILHASPEGRSLYESLGFNASNEMQINL